MPSKERQTADAIVSAFNTMDVDTIIALRTPECRRVFLPSSLKYPGQINDAYRANLISMKSVFTSFDVTVTDVIEGTSQESGNKKIVMYITARGDTAIGKYNNEYVWKLGFEESGERVNEWSEYVDVVSSSPYMSLNDSMNADNE